MPEGKYSTLIDKLRPDAAGAGEIVHLDGRVLGRHEGVSRYTVGQRRGLNVAVGDPLFVVKLDPSTKRVIVGPRDALLTRALTLKEVNWLGDQPSLEAAASDGAPVLARVRSTRDPAPARLAIEDGRPIVAFDAAKRASRRARPAFCMTRRRRAGSWAAASSRRRWRRRAIDSHNA